MDDVVLLIGNDINNINHGYEWSDLIDDLISFVGANGRIVNNNDKPFPLLYEEIFVEAQRIRKYNESDIKEFISEIISKLSPNPIHYTIANSNIRNILTTNYDLTIEKCVANNSHSLINAGIVRETSYSIFRHFKINSKNIWHIHGDANYSDSINLGYEQYCGYLQQMRNYIVTGTGNSYKEKLDPLTKRLKVGFPEKYSWLDYFFTSDVHIIGLRLDYVEIHLWWLLTFRKRSLIKNKFPDTNRIYYYYPEGLQVEIKDKLDLLRSAGVITIAQEYDESNRLPYYDNILNTILKDT